MLDVASQAPTSTSMEFTKFELAAASIAGSLLIPAGDAMAKGGEFGIIEGRSVALLHPLGMALLFGTTVYAGYLGFQWRRVITMAHDCRLIAYALLLSPAPD